MIVLHAVILENTFYLWGETPPAPKSLPGRGRRGQKSLKNPGRSPELYPYDAGATGLCSALQEVGFRFKVGKRSAESMILRLPAAGTRPVPSSPLIADPRDPKGEATLLPWRVSALRLSTERAVEFICACMGKQILASGVIIGKDLVFWAQALRFAASLVTRQQFLPGLTEKKGGYSAKWKPVISGPDADCLAGLARAMPAVSRAGIGDKNSPGAGQGWPPAPSSASVLSPFIEEIVDTLVRSADPSTPAEGRRLVFGRF